MDKYHNRQEAGIILAKHLKAITHQEDKIVLALPRGGVPVAFEIAKQLSAPLDVFIVRKLGVPGHEELAFGALATGGAHVFNDEIIQSLQLDDVEIKKVIAKEEKELKRREIAYRDNAPLPKLKGKTVILVDDGIATGATMRVAIQSLRQFSPKKLIVAVPVADYDLSQKLEPLADEFICPLRPKHFYAVGAWYDDFGQTEDEEVHQLLNQSKDFTTSI